MPMPLDPDTSTPTQTTGMEEQPIAQPTEPSSGTPAISPEGTPLAATAKPASEDEVFDSILEASAAGIKSDYLQKPDPMASEMDVMGSAAAGAAKAFFETKDFLVGEPEYKDKSTPRKLVETLTARREMQNTGAATVNGFSRNIAQFTTGYLGSGPLGWIKAGTKVKGAIQMGRAAMTGAVAFDPHEARLSNLVEQYPSLSNPITRYLKADIGDTKAEGRLKATLESLGADTIIAGVFVGISRAAKLRKAGKAAEAAVVEAEAAQTLAKEQAKTFFVDTQGRAATSLQDADFAARADGMVDEARANQSSFLEPWEVRNVEQRSTALQAEGLTKAAADKQALEDSASEAYKAETARIKAFDEGIDDNLWGDPDAPKPTRSNPPAGVDGGPTGAPPVSGGDGAVGARAIPEDTGAPRDATISERVEAIPGRPPRAEPETVIELPQIDVSPEDAFKRMERDNAAISKAGTMQEAIDDGYRFGAQDQPLMPKFSGTDEAAAWFGQTVEAAASRIQAARGGKIGADGIAVQSDKQVNKVVDGYIRVLGVDAGLVMGTLQQAGTQAKNLAAKMETAFLIANKVMQDNYLLANQIAVGNFGKHGSRDVALAALKHEMAIAMEMAAQARAILAGAGRTVRRARGEFKARTDAMQAINLDSLDGEGLLTAVLKTNGDEVAMQKLARPGLLTQIADQLSALQAANLLWGWATHTINLGMNVGMLAWRPLEQGVGAMAMQGAAKLTGNKALSASAAIVRRQSIKEVTGSFAALSDGYNAAKDAFISGDSRLSPHAIEALHDSGTGMQRIGTGGLSADMWRPINGLDDLAYNALVAFQTGTSMPLRAMGAADEAIRTVRYRAVLIARATVEAEEMGLKVGSKEAADYVKTRVEAGFDEAGRGVDADALAEAKSTVFGQDLLSGANDDLWFKTSLGAWVQQGTSNWAPMRAIVPFVRTPTNLFRYGVKLTPGLNLLQKEYLNAIKGSKGPIEQSRAIGQMMMGTMLATMAVPLVLNGTLTGSGPVGPQKQKAWKAMGNMPYAVNWTDADGKHQSFQLNRLDPIQFPLMLMADAVALFQSGTVNPDDEQSIGSALVLALSHQLSDKTYLKNMSDALKALGDPEITGEQYAQNLAQTFVPFATLMRNATGQEYMKEIHGKMDTLKASLPGWADDVPDRYDQFGEKQKVAGRFINTRTTDGVLDAALQEVNAETGYIPLQMSPRNTAQGVDYRDIELEDGTDAFSRLQELSSKPRAGMRSMKDTLTKLVSSASYERALHGPPNLAGTKEYMIAKVISDYRGAARAELMRTSKAFREKMGERARNHWNASVANRKDPKAEGAKATIKSVTPLLESFGLSGVIPNQQ